MVEAEAAVEAAAEAAVAAGAGVAVVARGRASGLAHAELLLAQPRAS